MKTLDSWDYRFSLQFTQTLTDAQKLFVEQCVGYSASKNVRGETPSFTWISSQFDDFVTVCLDTTKSRRDDLGDVFSGFWVDVETYFFSGSPIRKRCGTQLFENTVGLDMNTLLENVTPDS